MAGLDCHGILIKMKTRIVVSTGIAAPKESVFRYLQDSRLHYLWNASLRKLEPEATLKLGSKYTSHNSVLGHYVQASNIVTRLEPPKSIEITNTHGPLKYTVAYELHTTADGTKLICTCDIESNIVIFPYAAPVLE